MIFGFSMGLEARHEKVLESRSDTIINQKILRLAVQRMSTKGSNRGGWRGEDLKKDISADQILLMEEFIGNPYSNIMSLLASEEWTRTGCSDFEAVSRRYPTHQGARSQRLEVVVAYASARVAEPATSTANTSKLEKRGGLICHFMSARKGCRMGISDCCDICCTKVKVGTAGPGWAEDCRCPTYQHVIVTSGPTVVTPASTTYVTPATVTAPQTQTYVTPVTYNTPVTYTTVYH
ncbi:uncharacterized protein MELLADRAFT_103580 [Melampsora larici-populina 98AG31]|uniref:Uncharacterized protein n=1 Tax=Melampsora larici-populina (strain 98AG31 / pathotype 3-4-7) TaxID=747676 RepID=F4RBT5_MELLP|nr:uncharacterized protein MELLADRAFT_103580 [Melampsora larici-populina 98AG31]EGG10160.1 hypothetical protein MELLADRAFT_103580 [Melampsora larici-populina 98AG31]